MVSIKKYNCKNNFYIKTKKHFIIIEKKYKILLAEDDEINQKIYIFGLENYFDEIHIAINGKEVLSKIKHTKYDALIMDLEMPEMNGIETIIEIRKNEKNHLPIIAITAHSLIYNESDILKFGFDDYFIKPFKIKDIYNSIIQIIYNINSKK